MAKPYKACRVPGCNSDANQKGAARGYCRNHYHRLRIHGDPLGGRVSKGTTEAWLREHTSFSGDGCLKWPFATNQQGYGVATCGGKVMSASRAMCMLAHGEPPGDRPHAAHQCHNPVCVNPRHLRWESQKENIGDGRRENGTIRSGENCNLTKITEPMVREIRALNGKLFQREIAQRFGITQTNVSLIVRRKSWAWLE